MTDPTLAQPGRPPETGSTTQGVNVADLKTHIAELEKRPERKVDTIEVQHLLVAHFAHGLGH